MSDVKVKITADNSGLKTGLQKAKGHVDKFANETESAFGRLGGALAGVFTIGAFTQAIASAINFADAIDETATALDMSGESLQGLQGAFLKSGVNAEKFRIGMSELNKSLQDARTNTGSARNSFDALGLKWEDIRDKSPDQILYLISEGMKNAEDKTAALVAVMDLLGKAGKGMATELRGGADAMREHADGVKKLSDDEVKSLGALRDAWDDVTTSAKVYTGKAITGMSPSNNPSAGSMLSDAWKGVKKVGSSIFNGNLGETLFGEVKPLENPVVKWKENLRGFSPRANEGPTSPQSGKTTVDPRIAKQIEDSAKEAMETMRKEQEISDAIRDGELDRAQALTETLEKEKALTLEKEKQKKIDEATATLNQKRTELGEAEGRAQTDHDKQLNNLLSSPDERRERRREDRRTEQAEKRLKRVNSKELVDDAARGRHGGQEAKDRAQNNRDISEIRKSIHKLEEVIAKA